MVLNYPIFSYRNWRKNSAKQYNTRMHRNEQNSGQVDSGCWKTPEIIHEGLMSDQVMKNKRARVRFVYKRKSTRNNRLSAFINLPRLFTRTLRTHA